MGNYWRRVFYCSESSESEADSVAEAEAKAGEEEAKEADSKTAGAIVPTKPRPEDCLTVSLIFPFSTYFCMYGPEECVYFCIEAVDVNCLC